MLRILLRLRSLIAMGSGLNHNHFMSVLSINGTYHLLELLKSKDHTYLPFHSEMVFVNNSGGSGGDSKARTTGQKYFTTRGLQTVSYTHLTLPTILLV